MIKNRINIIIKTLGVAGIRSFDRMIAAFTANKMILTEEEFPFSSSLHANLGVLKQEYKEGAGQKMQSIKDFFRGEEYLVEDDNWQAIPIVLFNYLFKENAEKYAATYGLIRSLPGCCGAMISVLGPGKHIPPHIGVYKGIYRCLFTLDVEPDADCWIRIRDQKLFFREGHSIIFDETFEHEVMNNSGSPRVVLFLDFYRVLPFPMNFLNDIAFAILRKSAFVTNLLEKYSRLEPVSIESYQPAKSTLQI